MNKETMCSRLMSLGLPKSSSHQLVEQIGVWQNCSGPEWTVARLKEIKVIYLNHLAGGNYRTTEWIRMSKGIPTGPVKPLFSMSKRNLSKVLTALTSYSAYVSSNVTEAQKRKFFESMESLDETGLESKLKAKFTFNRLFVKPDPPTLWEYCTSPSKRAPSGDGRTVVETDVAQCFFHGAKSNAVRMIVARHEDYFRRVIPTDLFFNVEPHPYEKETLHSLGFISAIQEPGFKLRAIANPSRVLQAALEPLKNILIEVLSGVETDATLDQRRAVMPIQQWLKEGRTVYSVDLSDATNLFPWYLQKELLLDTVPESFYPLVDIMDYCATEGWSTNLKSGSAEMVYFSRGQPLGLGPSFHTFALAHNTLLQGICDKHKIENRFFVLGDDVVIGDRKLHRIYRATLKNLGCKISEKKSFSSKFMAEFAGMTILPDRFGHGYKWRDVSDVSCLSLAQNLGRACLGMLRPHQRELVEALGPIPKFLGGCGWSDGRDLTEFFDSLLGQAYVLYAIEKDLKERAVCYRDLTAELVMFFHRYGSELQTDLHRRYMDAASWRQLDVSAFIDSPLLKQNLTSVVRPYEVVSVISDRARMSELGYYPVVERRGDPRPSGISLLLHCDDELLNQFPPALKKTILEYKDRVKRLNQRFSIPSIEKPKKLPSVEVKESEIKRPRKGRRM